MQRFRFDAFITVIQEEENEGGKCKKITIQIICHILHHKITSVLYTFSTFKYQLLKVLVDSNNPHNHYTHIEYFHTV